MKTLDQFETDFHSRISGSAADARLRAGALLPIVPSRSDWDAFLAAAKVSWPTWREKLENYPTSLVVLYGGLAFFEYEDTVFWPKFAAAVGAPDKALAGSLYKRLNEVYCASVERLGLRLISNAERTSYVGSAVHHIGIPLSLWDGFLDICDWALVREGWRDISPTDWETAVTRISGSRRRLKMFLLGNRESASEIIAEMIEARQWLATDQNLTIDGIKRVCFLRPEYFDEIPETAEFLRPDSPDSLFRDRPRLSWNEQKGSIVLHVPGLDHDKLPATWTVDGKIFKAGGTPGELQLDGAAFNSALSVQLSQRGAEEAVRLAGAKPWALFDVERSGYLVNSSREMLPLRGYALVSAKPLLVKRDGFEEEDYPANEAFELKDGSGCFITRLWPKDRSATLTISDGSAATTLRFRTRKRIEARLFISHGFRSAWYQRNGEQLNVEGLPLVCVLVPQGYFPNANATLNSSFKVSLDAKPAGGNWQSRGEALDDYELFHWHWSDRPFLESKGGKVTDFKKLGGLFKPLDLRGAHTLAVEARSFGIRFSYSLFIQPAKDGIARCWKNLPGRYLPWFLLTQSPDGLKSEELEFASPVIEPGIKFPYYFLKQYADAGLFVQRGRRWTIRESRARITNDTEGICTVRFCGDPAIIWGLYRKMVYLVAPPTLPEIVVSESSEAIERCETKLQEIKTKIEGALGGSFSPQSRESMMLSENLKEGARLESKIVAMTKSREARALPHLRMSWPAALQHELTRFLMSRNVQIVGDLWSR